MGRLGTPLGWGCRRGSHEWCWWGLDQLHSPWLPVQHHVLEVYTYNSSDCIGATTAFDVSKQAVFSILSLRNTISQDNMTSLLYLVI